MPIHPDWKPLYDAMMQHYCDGSSEETSPKGGPCPKGEQVFYAYCREHGIDYTKPRPKGEEAFRWVGDVLPQEEREGRFFIRGRAIHPTKTYHPGQWPEVRVYLEEELKAAAETLSGKPLLIDHCIVLDPPNRVLAARWEDGAVEFVAEVDEDIYNLVKSGEIKHCSIEYEWQILEKVDGIAPRRLNFVGLSLLRRLKPGDPEASVEVWEGIIKELRELSEEKRKEEPVEEGAKPEEEAVGTEEEAKSAEDKETQEEAFKESSEESQKEVSEEEPDLKLILRELSDAVHELKSEIATLREQREDERERLRRERERRAERYGIEIRPDGHLTPPAEYRREGATDPEDYGDPVNYMYPLHKEENARNALARWGAFRDYYKQQKSRNVIYERIVRACLKYGIEVRWNPDLPEARALPENLKSQLRGYEEEAQEQPSGLGRGGKPRAGQPKTDMERLISHYGEEKAKALYELIGDDAFKLLPERGSGLEEAERRIKELEEKVESLEREKTELEAKLQEAIVEPGVPEIPPGYIDARRILAILPKKVPYYWGGGPHQLVRRLRKLCREALSSKRSPRP